MNVVSIESVQNWHDRVVQDVKTAKSLNDKASLMVKYNTLLRILTDIDQIRRTTYKSEALKDLEREIHKTEKDIKVLLVETELSVEQLYNSKVQEETKVNQGIENEPHKSETETITGDGATGGAEIGESLEGLKSRLLSTTHSELDHVQSAEIQNNYHESIQKELIDSLPSMVSSLKEQALQFQEMVKQDALILKEATQNFESSHGKFENVNNLLSKYHKEGRLGFWFYIRITAMVLVAFMFLLIIIRLIPARH